MASFRFRGPFYPKLSLHVKCRRALKRDAQAAIPLVADRPNPLERAGLLTRPPCLLEAVEGVNASQAAPLPQICVLR